MSNVDVLIVGAGPTGLMSALLCTHSGLRCRIIDQGVQQSHESRALAVQARSLELMKNLGIVEKFLAQGQRAKGVSIFLNGREKANVDFANIGREDTPFPFVHLLSQAENERNLAEELAARGITVEHETTLENFTQDETTTKAKVRRKDGSLEEIQASYIVGCDGAHSRVRHALGLSFEGAAYADDFLLADAKVEWDLPHDRLMIFLGPKNLAVFFPIKGAELSRAFALNPPNKKTKDETTETTSSPIELKEVETAFQEATQKSVRLTDPKWLTRFRLHHRGVDRYRVGRAFVAGDAAHIHSPAGGQGMNTGLQDAANLIWKMALVQKGVAPDRLLDTYHSERFPIGQKLLKFTDRLFKRMTAHGPIQIALRNLVLPIGAQVMKRFPEVRRRAFHFVSQLGIRYHASDVVVDRGSPTAGAKQGPVAGERWPDADLGEGRTLLGLAKDYRFHLFVVSREDLPEQRRRALCREIAGVANGPLNIETHFIAREGNVQAEGVIVPSTDEVFDRLGIQTSATYLVRPDGYVAERRTNLDLTDIGSSIASVAFQ